MSRTLAVLAALLVAGCATFAKPADTVSFDRVTLALTLGKARTAVAILESKAVARCRTSTPAAQRWDLDTCQEITDLLGQARQIDDEIETALLNPQIEIDWGKVATAISIIVKIAMKFA